MSQHVDVMPGHGRLEFLNPSGVSLKTSVPDLLPFLDLPHPDLEPCDPGGEDGPRGLFLELLDAPESLNLFVIYWYAPPAWWDYMEHAERLNLRIFEEFERAGIEFAFPTQTLYLAGDPKRKLAVEMLGADLKG